MEQKLERLFFASRWLLVPFYLGLVLGLVLLLVSYCSEIWHTALYAAQGSSKNVVLGLLDLVDLSLVGSLIVMVIFTGYESFVSKIDSIDMKKRPDWMGKLDFSALKLRIIASIVAISAIHLLRVFMNVDKTETTEITWMVVIHVALVFSGCLMALTDLLATIAKSKEKH